MTYQEIYISTDIEADGPIPGVYSMMSFGSAAYDQDGNLLDTFSRNLLPLQGAVQDPDTMLFWQRNPQVYAITQVDRVDPAIAIPEYDTWLSKYDRPVFVSMPAGFDFTFIYWYLVRFTGKSRFSWAALDIKTFAYAVLNKPFKKCTKANFPESWFSNKPHTHVAIDDALEQGDLFFNIKKANDKLRKL